MRGHRAESFEDGLLHEASTQVHNQYVASAKSMLSAATRGRILPKRVTGTEGWRQSQLRRRTSAAATPSRSMRGLGVFGANQLAVRTVEQSAERVTERGIRLIEQRTNVGKGVERAPCPCPRA